MDAIFGKQRNMIPALLEVYMLFSLPSVQTLKIQTFQGMEGASHSREVIPSDLPWGRMTEPMTFQKTAGSSNTQ